jgi:hypothetical protein
MANFAETMVYWYLRLNGFFPLTNFVMHKAANCKYTTDCDILAVRFPHVFETVGGQADDWDTWFQKSGFALEQKFTGLIVEVKTGKLGSKDVIKVFSEERLLYALQRTGFWPQDECRYIARELQTDAGYQTEGYHVAKLLISSSVPKGSGLPPCYQLRLKVVNAFIKARMQKYKDHKEPDRMFFPDDLIQCLISASTQSDGEGPGVT